MGRDASSVLFGFDFQSNAAIVLMIENFLEMESIRIEGEEDIEIRLSNGAFVIAQAKSVVKSSTDFDNVRQKGRMAMKSLSEASQKMMVKQIVYITNSPNPFNDEASRPMFNLWSRVKYSYLPDQTKEIILDWLSEIDSPLDTDKLTIEVIPFETDDDVQRYKVVKQVISDFIGDLQLYNRDGLRNRLHEVWQVMFDKNGSKSDRAIRLTKKDIVWPIIVFVTGYGQLDRNSCYCTDLDEGEFVIIQSKYRELIEDTCERFDLSVKVITDFYEKNMSGRQAIERFIEENWMSYQDDFGLEQVDASLKVSLTKIFLYTILKSRYDIDNIKKSVKL